MGEFLFIWCVHKVDCWYHLELLLYIKKKIFKSWPSFALSIYAFDLTLCLCAFDLIFHVCVCVSITGGDIIGILYIYFWSALPLSHISSSHKFLVLLVILFCFIVLLVYFSDQTTLS